MTRIITDNNWRDQTQDYGLLPRFMAYGSTEARGNGMTPFSDSLDQLIPWDDLKERINEANERRQMPIHHLEANDAKAHNQGRTNYCWAYGITLCLEALRPMENQRFIRLGPPSLGFLVGWKNRGNYLSSAIKGAIERGVASAEFVGDGISDSRQFKTGWEANALLHKPHEFTDLDRSMGEQGMAQQCVSMLVAGCPLYEAFNWWGHALARVGVVWDETQKFNLRWIDWNSHNDGRIEMTGTRGIPDEAYAVRTTTVSS